MKKADLNSDTLHEEATAVVNLVHSHQLPLCDEKSLQGAMERVLADAGVVAMVECALGPGDVVDFLTEEGLAIECKLKAQKRGIHRQLSRYAKHDAVRGLLLVSNTPIGLPQTIDGKPVFFASLGRGWL